MILSRILMKNPWRTTINRKPKSNPHEKEIKCSIWSNTTSGRTLFYVLFIEPWSSIVTGRQGSHSSQRRTLQRKRNKVFDLVEQGSILTAAEFGATNRHIARVMGVSESSIRAIRVRCGARNALCNVLRCDEWLPCRPVTIELHGSMNNT